MSNEHGRSTLRFTVLPAASLCAGVVAQLLLPWLLPWPLAAGLLLASMSLSAAAFALHRGGFLPPAVFLFGFALCALHGISAIGQRLPSTLIDRVVTVQGYIDGLPESTPSGSRFVFQIEQALYEDPEAAAALEGRRLKVRWWRGGRGMEPGQRWQLRLRLRGIRSPTNPGAADQGAMALRLGTDGEAQVEMRSRPVRLQPAQGVDALRDAISARVDQSVAKADAAGFVKALAVGDTRGISDADWDALRRFGLTHLIAISGFHVGLVAGLGAVMVAALWRLFPQFGHQLPRPQAAAAAALLVAVAYAALAGFSLPTVRTVLMIAVVVILRWLRASTAASQTLAAAVTVIAVVDPLALMSPGFWLSAGGVGVLMWTLPGASSAWDWRVFLKAQWVASLGLLPFTALFFSQVPVLGPLANLVGIPWISLVVVPLSLAGVILDPLSHTLGAWVWGVAAAAMNVLWSGLHALPETWSALVWAPNPGAVGWILAFAGVALALLPRGMHWRWLGLLMLAPLLLPPTERPKHGGLLVRVFDVPGGEATLVRTATRNVLIGAGPISDAGNPFVAPLLAASGVERLDLLVIARRAAGHSGAVRPLVRDFSPTTVWQPPTSGTHVSKCALGSIWKADGVVIDVLHPEAGTPLEGGDADCVLRVSTSTRELLLVADSGRWIAARVVRETPFALAPQWIVAGPRGAAEWSVAFLQAKMILSRQPGPAAERQLPNGTLRPDQAGAITVRIDPAGRAEVEGWRLRRSHWWDGNSP